jgi:hypothetical protein
MPDWAVILTELKAEQEVRMGLRCKAVRCAVLAVLAVILMPVFSPAPTAGASTQGVRVIDAKEHFSFYAPPGFRAFHLAGTWVSLYDSEAFSKIIVDNPYGQISFANIESYLEQVALAKTSYSPHIVKAWSARYSFGIAREVYFTANATGEQTLFGVDARFLSDYRAYEVFVDAYSSPIARAVINFVLKSWGT